MVKIVFKPCTAVYFSLSQMVLISTLEKLIHESLSCGLESVLTYVKLTAAVHVCTKYLLTPVKSSVAC